MKKITKIIITSLLITNFSLMLINVSSIPPNDRPPISLESFDPVFLS